jgi:hypothetical protein
MDYRELRTQDNARLRPPEPFRGPKLPFGTHKGPQGSQPQHWSHRQEKKHIAMVDVGRYSTQQLNTDYGEGKADAIDDGQG